jgi:hypothetical protein
MCIEPINRALQLVEIITNIKNNYLGWRMARRLLYTGGKTVCRTGFKDLIIAAAIIQNKKEEY